MMKRFIPLSLLFLSFIHPAFNLFPPESCPFPDPPMIWHPCNQINPFQSLNFIGTSLISNSNDSIGLQLCPGDAFGDLNETYVTLKGCKLIMYHKNKIFWSKGEDQFPWRGRSDCFDGTSDCACLLSLKRDGNMVLIQEKVEVGEKSPDFWPQWESLTDLNPAKTELRLEGQQIQIVQTFPDGSQRLFYLDENQERFKEDLGQPIKVAEKFIIKNHIHKENTILRRNEYIGDLNSTHLIFQEDCQLQLFNKNNSLWSFISYFDHDRSCRLTTKGPSSVGILSSGDWGFYQTIMAGNPDLEAIQSKITFDDDQLIITQTLKNGSETIFLSGTGQDTMLKLKREPRQIAERVLYIPKNGSAFLMERMDYIGDLAGLHLILEQNCSLLLRNVYQKLWETKLKTPAENLFECSLVFGISGIAWKTRGSLFDGDSYLTILLFEYFETSTDKTPDITGYQLKLEDNQLIITCERTDGALDLYHAGSNTRGAILQRIAETSVIINHNDENDKTLPRMSYIGDLNGVYAIFNECNWVLYNKTQMVWESGAPQGRRDFCILILKRDGEVSLQSEVFSPAWRRLTQKFFDIARREQKVLKTELMVNNDGLWIIYTLKDRTLVEYNAIEATNRFSLEGVKEQFIVNSDL